MSLRWIELGARVTVVTSMPARAVPGRFFGQGDPAYHGKVFAVEDYRGLHVLRSWAFRTSRPGFLPTIANNASFMASAAAHAMARLGPFDVLIASSPPLFPHVAGAVVVAARGGRLVLEVRDLWPDYLVDMGAVRRNGMAGRALFALERALLRRADAIAVVTDSFRERLIAKGARPDSVHVLPNGVDLAQYHRDDSGVPLPALQVRPGEFVAGYLGTFGSGQALTDLVDVASVLAEHDSSVRIVLAGDGLQKARVVAAAAERRLTNLSILPPIAKSDTRAFYNSCDVCLVPLAPIPVFQETVPSKIFEVMACERPVLASLDGEGRRIVERAGAGVVVPPGDARAIAEALLRLKAMPLGERLAMGTRGRAFVAAHYDRQQIADRYLEMLREISARTR